MIGCKNKLRVSKTGPPVTKQKVFPAMFDMCQSMFRNTWFNMFTVILLYQIIISSKQLGYGYSGFSRLTQCDCFYNQILISVTKTFFKWKNTKGRGILIVEVKLVC